MKADRAPDSVWSLLGVISFFGWIGSVMFIILKSFGTAQTPCFRASAYGNTSSRVKNDIFRMDCNNARNF